MSYTIVFDPKFTAHLERHRRAGSIGLLRKIDTLLEELEQHPRSGTGHPEPMRHIRRQPLEPPHRPQTSLSV